MLHIAGIIALLLAIYTLIKWIWIDPYTSPLRKLRMPPGGEGIVGHQNTIME
jgi:hypothetical protein